MTGVKHVKLKTEKNVSFATNIAVQTLVPMIVVSIPKVSKKFRENTCRKFKKSPEQKTREMK